MPTRGLLLLALVTLAAVVASWIAVDGRYRLAAFEQREAGSVFPGLARQVSEIATIEVVRAAGRFTLARRDGSWANLGLGGFPAKQDLVEGAVAAVAGLRFTEPKTTRERLYPKLEVEEVAPGAKSTRLTFRDGGGGLLADLIVGKAKARGVKLNREGLYLRLPGAERAWLAEGALDVRYDALGWSDHEIVDIAARSVASLTVVHADGERVELHRAGPQDRKLTLKNLPAGARVEQQHQIDFMAGLLSVLKFSDARPADPAEDMAPPAFEARVRSIDHLRVVLRAGAAAGDGTLWARIDAEVADGAEASGQARREAARIRSRFAGWSLKLPRRISDRLKIRLSDIVGGASTGGATGGSTGEGQEP